MKTTNWRILAVAGVVFAHIAFPIPANSQTPTNITLDFNSLPSAQGWEFFNPYRPECNPQLESDIFSADGTGLLTDTIGAGYCAYYYVWYDVVSETDSYTVDITIQNLDYEPLLSYGMYGAFGFGAQAGSNSCAFSLAPYAVYIGGETAAIFNTTDALHTYRAEAIAGEACRLYIDGELAWSGLPYDEPDVYRLSFGNGTSWENTRSYVTNFEFNIVGNPPELACVGFEPPMEVYPVTVKGPRALPLKAQLFDADGVSVTDMEIAAAPVLQVLFDSGEPGDPIDVTDDALPAGLGTDGNQFVFTEDMKWQYNLNTKEYTAPGTYSISMLSGDDTEYVIEPTCVTSFVRK